MRVVGTDSRDEVQMALSNLLDDQAPIGDSGLDMSSRSGYESGDERLSEKVDFSGSALQELPLSLAGGRRITREVVIDAVDALFAQQGAWSIQQFTEQVFRITGASDLEEVQLILLDLLEEQVLVRDVERYRQGSSWPDGGESLQSFNNPAPVESNLSLSESLGINREIVFEAVVVLFVRQHTWSIQLFREEIVRSIRANDDEEVQLVLLNLLEEQVLICDDEHYRQGPAWPDVGETLTKSSRSDQAMAELPDNLSITRDVVFEAAAVLFGRQRTWSIQHFIEKVMQRIRASDIEEVQLVLLDLLEERVLMRDDERYWQGPLWPTRESPQHAVCSVHEEVLVSDCARYSPGPLWLKSAEPMESACFSAAVSPESSSPKEHGSVRRGVVLEAVYMLFARHSVWSIQHFTDEVVRRIGANDLEAVQLVLLDLLEEQVLIRDDMRYRQGPKWPQGEESQNAFCLEPTTSELHVVPITRASVLRAASALFAQQGVWSIQCFLDGIMQFLETDDVVKVQSVLSNLLYEEVLINDCARYSQGPSWPNSTDCLANTNRESKRLRRSLHRM